MKKNRFKKDAGFIDYCYYINDKYPNGILIFMGSFVKKEYRGNGVFKQMVKELFKMFPLGTEVHVALVNKVLVNFFKRLGFIETESIEYWGKPENTTNLKHILSTQE